MLQLLDLAGMYFRAFYAVPASMTGPHGRPVNAIRGTLDILSRVIADGRPTRAIACLDLDWRPAWRVALVPSYKTHRVAIVPGSPALVVDPGAAGLTTAAVGEVDVEVAPDELSPQVPVLLEVLAAIGIPLAGAPECEADDVIGTLATRERVDPVEVVTGDRDLFQLVRAQPTPVVVRYIGGGMSRVDLVDVPRLRAKYGVDGPGYAAMATLRGDPSDGLPGVKGIGEKTAVDLINRFGSIEALLREEDHPAGGLSATLQARLHGAADYLRAAVQVVAVATDAAVSVDPAEDDRLPRTPAHPATLAALVREHGIGGPVERLLDVLRATGNSAAG
jgi:5'-3' exonuclease